MYEETLEKDLLNGYVAKVYSDTEDSDSIASFLPHHPVTNENKPGKMRRVANASSVFQGQSLNSNLLKGSDRLSNLAGVILRFREDNIALSADIEQIFMQVKLTPECQKFLRFLWINDCRVDTYEYTSHVFGATDSPCIASYTLRKSARDSCEQFPDVIEYIERNVYMDNLYVATDSVERAQRILREMRATLSRGGFNFTKWNSNSSEFLATLEPGMRLDPSKVQPQNQKALGLPWNPITDCYMIETKLFRKINFNEAITRRKLLRFVASLFDPLGFIAPLTIRLRKVLQAAWNQGPKWDKPLLVQNFPDFVTLRDKISNFKDLQIPRNYFLDRPIRSVQLHTFTDASQFAVSAVCYIRVEYSDQSIAVRFVIGKLV